MHCKHPHHHDHGLRVTVTRRHGPRSRLYYRPCTRPYSPALDPAVDPTLGSGVVSGVISESVWGVVIGADWLNPVTAVDWLNLVSLLRVFKRLFEHVQAVLRVVLSLQQLCP